jgi:glycosyltransferase involved in cell wall biosynthesis
MEMLIDAAAELAQIPGLPAWSLRVVGPHAITGGGGGEMYRDALVARAAAIPAPAPVEWPGPIYDPIQLADEYGRMDIFCYPSVAERGETFGVAIAEAMASGAVPVVSSLSCFRDLVVPDRTGVVFDHRAADGTDRLAASLRHLLTHSDERRRMADAAQQHARHLDYRVIAAEMLQDLQVLSASPKHGSV